MVISPFSVSFSDAEASQIPVVETFFFQWGLRSHFHWQSEMKMPQSQFSTTRLRQS
jgi:hypothetical protein